MTSEVTVRNTDNFVDALQDIEQTQAMCEKLMAHKHYAKMGPEGIYAIVARAKSLGLAPLDALSGALYFVQGRVGMSTEAMASLIRQAGHSIVKDPKSNNDCCILHGKRKDNGDTWTCVFSMDDARRAGLAKNMYEKYPSIMLYNRCMSMLARQLFPDVIKGCGYTLDELKEIAKNDESKAKPDVQSFEISVQPAAFQVVNNEKKLTANQVTDLLEIMDQCDPEFVKEKMDALTKIPGWSGMESMSFKVYERLLQLATQNKQEYLKKMLGGEDEQPSNDKE